MDAKAFEECHVGYVPFALASCPAATILSWFYARRRLDNGKRAKTIRPGRGSGACAGTLRSDSACVRTIRYADRAVACRPATVPYDAYSVAARIVSCATRARMGVSDSRESRFPKRV